MKLNKRSNMRLKDLRNVGAKQVATFSTNGVLSKSSDDVDLSKPGFYFMVHRCYGTVAARFFVGIQRSKSGFANTASQLRNRRTSVGSRIMNSNSSFDVYFLSIDKMKPLTTAFGKGKLATVLTLAHSSKYQTMDELNRMLNDNFKFYAQAY